MSWMTVGELATTRPLSVGVLQRHGIDFCCGGATAFPEACAAAGVAPATLLDEIGALERSAAAPPTRWDLEAPTALIEHLITRYHHPLRLDLETLELLAVKVHRVHGAKDERLVRIRDAVSALRVELLRHLSKEEQILFPWIARADAPPPHGPVAVMFAEHADAGSALRELEQLTDGYRLPVDACRSWTALWDTLARVDRELREHIALENNVLFPRALER